MHDTSQSLIHQVSVSDVVNWDSLLEDWNSIVSIPYSSGLSFRYNSRNILSIRFESTSQSLIHQVSVSDPDNAMVPIMVCVKSQSLIHQVSVSDDRMRALSAKYNDVSIPYSSGLSFRLLLIWWSVLQKSCVSIPYSSGLSFRSNLVF